MIVKKVLTASVWRPSDPALYHSHHRRWLRRRLVSNLRSCAYRAASRSPVVDELALSVICSCG
jgi:hypothetical protein